MKTLALQGEVWFLKKLSIELPYYPAISLLSIHLKDLKTDYLYASVHWSIIHNGQKVETTQVSTDRWIGRQNIDE